MATRFVAMVVVLSKMADKINLLSQSYLDQKFHKFLTEYENNNIIIDRHHCHFKKNSRQEGYQSYKLQENNITIHLKLHAFIYYMFFKNIGSSSNRCNVSHLCGKKNCLNIHHLCLEPHIINMNRIICHKRGSNGRKNCTGHKPYPDCCV